jgi:hypothetical protein
MFQRVEGEAFLALVRDLIMVDDPAITALFAIRSDSYAGGGLRRKRAIDK